MQEFLRTAGIMWIGCCIRNKEDRDKTFKFIETIGNQVEQYILPKTKEYKNETE